MEDGDEFLGAQYSCGEDLDGNCVLPLSYTYTPFSIEIPNNYCNVIHPSPLPHPHRPAPHITPEVEWACPSVWDNSFNAHSYSCPFCCDPSSPCLSQLPQGCYYDGLLPQPWTPGGAVQYHTSSAGLCDAVVSINSEDKQMFSTRESSRQHDQQVESTYHAAPSAKKTVEKREDSMRSFLEKSKKPCHCTKSQCLKLYCDCFANGEICSDCSCINCCNNMKHATARFKAIKGCLNRNPDAFHSKVSSGVQGEVKGIHTRGCNCKSSGCLKNYCECYKAKIKCSSVCKCVRCSNYSRGEVKESAVQKSSHSHYSNTQHRTKSSESCMTYAVVEATCGCLLAKAEKAEEERLSHAQAERAILEEFGYCLTQILHFKFKHTQS